MYALIKDNKVEKYPYSLSQLQQDNPDTSFPAEMSAEFLAGWGVRAVRSGLKPSVDYTKNVTEATPVNDDGWRQVWVVTDATQEEIAQRTANQAISIRAERDQKLADSDWTQLPDSPVNKEAWSIYRQALRDVPSQAGFPWSVTWPQQPE